MASNVNVNVSLNATAFQAGTQQFTASVNQMQGSMATFANSLNTTQQQINQLITVVNQLANANQNASGAFGAFLGANIATDAIREFTDSLRELIVESTYYAARTQELGVALSAIAKSTGTSTQLLAQQEFAMKQLNITTQDARQTLIRFMQANLDLSKSGALARTAQDLAVVSGVSTSEEINKLIIGIQTLQSRNLRTAGVFLTVDEVLDRLAKTSNRARDSFSTLEKQQAVLNAVLEFGARQTGAYEAAMETASKQIRSLERVIAEAQNAIGNQFVPVLALAVKAVTALFQWIEAHPRTFLLLAAGAGAVAVSFTLLNTRLYQTLANVTALTTIGFVRMIASLRIFSVNVAAAETSIIGFTGATVAATGAVTGFQLALGGITAVIGIAGLIAGLAAAFSGIEEPAEKFTKITDTQILQSTGYIKSIQERRKAVIEYQDTLKLVQDNPVIGQGVVALQEIDRSKAAAAESQAQVDALQKQISGLRAEEQDLTERINKGLQKDIAEESKGLTGLIQARTQNNASLDAQQKKLEASVSVNKLNQEQQRIAIDQFKQLTNSNAGLILTTADVASHTERYNKVLQELSPNERAVLQVQLERVGAVQALVNTLDVLERREAEVLAARIAGLTSNISIAKREEQTRLDNIQTREIELVQLQKQLQVYEEMKAAGQTQVETSPNVGVEGSSAQYQNINDVIEQTQQQIIAVNKAIGENGNALDENQGKLAEQYRQLLLIRDQFGGTTEELYKLLSGLGLFPGTLDEFNKSFQEAEIFMKGFRDQVRDVELGVNSVEEQLKNLKFPAGTLLKPDETIGAYLNNLEHDRQKFIEDLQRRKSLSREDAINLFETDPKQQEDFINQFSEGFKKISEFVRKKFHADISSGLDAALLNNAFDDEGKIKQQYIGLFKTFDAIEKAAKKAARETKTEFERMQESLERTEEQIKSFLNAGSDEFKLRIKLEDAERTKKDLEAIFTLRYKLGIPLDVPIKRENIQRTRQELEVLAKLFDEIREANNAVLSARLGAGAPVIDAQVRAETALLKLVRERRNEEQQLASDVAVAITRRIKLESDAAEIRRLEARAFLEVLNEEQTVRENAITSLTKIQIKQGKTSFADQNSIIQEGLKVANSPIVTGLNDTQKVIAYSAEAIQKTQVDFGKALGDAIIKSSVDVNGELRNHAVIQTQSRDYLQQIANNTANLSSTGLGTAGIPNDAIHNYGNPFGRFSNSDVLNQPQIKSLLAAAGAPVQLIPTLSAIAIAESGGRVKVPNITSKETSLGLFQINQKAHGNKGIFSDENLLTPEGNTKAALEVLRKEGLDAWTTFTKGTYKKYLEGAREGATKTAFEYTQKSLLKNNGIPVIQPFIDTMSGKGGHGVGQAQTTIFDKLTSTLNLTDTANKLKLFESLGTEEGVKGAVRAAEELQALRSTLAERRANFEVRKMIVSQLNAEHLKDLQLADDEKEFQRLQELRVDKQFELLQQERELNSLRIGGVALLETLHEVNMERIKDEIEAEKSFIKTQEELRRRSDPDKRAHDVTLLLKKEYNQRINDELELDNRLAVLRKQVDDGYFTSIDNRRRIEKQWQANRLQEQIDLTHRIIELEDEIAHQGENAALRYAVAWREALLEVQKRHEDAVTRILKAQASIADQSTFDVARVRATVLEAIDQLEGVSESIGGLFNDTFKVYADDIDRWIDKTTDKMGNLGKIFNNFLKSISHRVLGNIEKTLLDAVFPPTPEEQAAKQGIKIGGIDEAEASFKQLQASALALGDVNLNTAQVTIETATALNGLTGAAAVASDALVQIGAIVAGISAQGGGASTGVGALSGLLNTSIGGGGSTGSGSLTSLSRAISGIGFGGLGTSPQSAGANVIQSIFSGAPSLNFGATSSNVPASVSALLEKMRNQPLTTTTGPLATLSGLGGSSGSGGGLKGILSGVFGQGVGGKSGLLSLFSRAGLKSFGAGLAPQLPLIGLGLGMSLGGPSKLGGILGGAGGLLLGGSGLAFLAPLLGLGGALGGAGGAAAGALGGAAGVGGAGGLLGTLTPLLTNPFTIAAGAALLVGAYFLGRKKQRQRDEKSRDELKGDAFSQIDQILKNVRADRMDGIDGITQAEAIRDQYFQQISTLKTKSVKQSAENYRPYFDAKIEAIRREADLQLRRKEISDKLVPEFALGGWVHEDQIIKVKAGERIIPPALQRGLAQYGGIIGGTDRGFDDTYMFAPAGTKIVPNSVTPSPVRSTDIRPITVNDQQGGNMGDIIINMESSFDENGLALRIVGSSTGQNIITNVTNQAITDRRVRRV